MKPTFWYVLVVLVCIGSILARSASAATLSNDTYILQTDVVNLQPKASKKTILPPLQEEAIISPTPEPLPKPFSFSLSTTLVDFGEITPTDPTTRTTTIHISPSNTLGFSLFALTDHELQSENKKIIPDTTCDNGSCNHINSSPWDNILTYGFGWQCESRSSFDCKSRFQDKTYFMQLPNQAKGNRLTPILFGKTDGQTTIIYKANISTTQDIGLYTNTLQLIAVPDF